VLEVSQGEMHEVSRRDDPRRGSMIRRLTDSDCDTILSVINDGATRYRGVVPDDCLGDPYMSSDELRTEIEAGVVFWGDEEGGAIAGVMGLQEVDDVTLVRHAYVRADVQGRGIGGRLLRHLERLTERPLLLGTWAVAVWAIRFYERHGFGLVSPLEKDRLLRRYWSIPERQIKTSVVLADARAFARGVVTR
jgi:GNAT superfamily N-acetyltransferase